METGASPPTHRSPLPCALRGAVRAVVIAVVLAVPPPVQAASDDVLGGASNGGSGGVAAAPPPVTVNEFIPEDRDLSDCLSAVPKPGCGSEARGGWRQGVVFGLVAVGMIAIGTRIAVAVRRRDAATLAASADGHATSTASTASERDAPTSPSP
jgi:hypothetical protein